MPLASWLGCRLGDAAAVTLSRRRRLSLANLRVAFPRLSPAEHRRLSRRSWQHLGMTYVELCRALVRPSDVVRQDVTLDGLEHLEAVLKAHGRALVFSAHLGNWELLPFALRLTTHPLSVVQRPLDSACLNPLADAMRRKAGIEPIDKQGALRGMLRSLKAGGVIAILLDQNASRHEGVFVPFFGRVASTSRSIAVLALRTGTPILPVFIRREGAGRHRATLGEPLAWPAANDIDEAVVELTMACNAAIEAAIREAPAQWLWIHDRWRTRPPGEAAQ